MMPSEPGNGLGKGANVDTEEQKDGAKRVIKRYSNRKLYDTRDSRYVTLLQIAEMVRCGEDVQIIDNTTKEDKTEVTLALAISEELKARPRAVSVGSLRTLIQERGEKLLTTLRESPIAHLIPGHETKPTAETAAETAVQEQVVAPTTETETPAIKGESRLAELMATSRSTIDQWQHAMDERIRTVIPALKELMDLQAEVRRLAQRVEELEARMAPAKVTAVESSPAAHTIDATPRVEVSESSNRSDGSGLTGITSAHYEMRADGRREE
jgi:polyhydroxyalkanoate synthesis repressor PhaR